MSRLTASHGLTLSDAGLKLIKAYEGYRPVDRTLVNGQRVVGYGHRLYDERPMQLSEAEAETLLKDDLKAFEDMVNENVHAPLTQGQFDALVSLAYNIGPKAFLGSDTLRALNNGRPLDAANGFDVWRKSTIDGKTYVVDALMRRRTAEKALFLKTSTVPQPATAADMPPLADESVATLSTEDALPTFIESKKSGFVAHVPLNHLSLDKLDHISLNKDMAPKSDERDLLTDNGSLETLMPDEGLEKRVEAEDSIAPFDDAQTNDINEDTMADIDVSQDIEKFIELGNSDSVSDEPEEESLPRSIIADAAADISERLDALIESAEQDQEDVSEEWPEALVSIPEPPKSNLLAFPQSRRVAPENESELETKTDSKVAHGSNSVEDNTKPTDHSDVLKESDVDIFIDNLVEDDALRQSIPSDIVSEHEPSSHYVDYGAPVSPRNMQSGSGYLAIIFVGFLILCAAIAGYIFDDMSLMGEWGPPLLLSSAIAGGVIVFSGIYYAIKNAFIKSW